ncbi:hypothetical protein C8R46DRAFT_1077286 [Mycena filopes]|nr:hypothetical protein C8R46DRAFT_1077286 [Mycena filopes]
MAAAPRKLLVLDLNGTLLLRSKHRASSPASFGPRPRAVHPRPYLNSFRDYIFHPSTMAWLDTMVWSSAQPRSVADMVNHCFGPHQRNFLAIWARDTLGLPPALYDKKIQTTKDLSKPWTAFPDHSSRTTLLLDDSALKAHRHPHNHVCVREYVQETRNHDLEVLRKRTGAKPPKNSKKQSSKSKKALPGVDLPPDETPPPAGFLVGPTYDETLLAIVGILESVKPQADVADWVRGGGLLLKDSPDAAIVDTPSPPSPAALASKMLALNLTQAQEQELWFDREAVVHDWVGRGVHALEALRIPVVAGMAD